MADFMDGYVPAVGSFSFDQVERLLRPIRPQRVFQSQGQSHVAAWDVTAHLSRMFGFGRWEKEILALDLVSERRGTDLGLEEKKGWYVTYRCLMRLHIRDQFGNPVCSIDDAATGTSSNLPQLGDAHDFAVKNAISYALKRCAKDLGDQFGLSLYNKGQTGPVVGMTLVHGPTDEPELDVEGEDTEPASPDPVLIENLKIRLKAFPDYLQEDVRALVKQGPKLELLSQEQLDEAWLFVEALEKELDDAV